MKDKTIRPAVSGHFSAEEYGTFFVGFPIWWGVAPTVVNTFLEDCGTEGKIIVPFAMSGGSGMQIVNAALESSCCRTELKEGKIVFAVRIRIGAESLGEERLEIDVEPISCAK